MSTHRSRSPVSTRHAFALAFDLALRRDPVQSLIVPLLLQAPWILALGLLPSARDADRPWAVRLTWLAAQLGTFFVWLVISAMLRFRARSVFNTPAGTPPATATDCYARGLKRVPWLVITEIVRNMSILLATFFFIVPALFLGFRLSFATEAVVLNEPHMAGAFQRSFRLTEGRFERWLEMIVVSVIVVFGGAFTGAVLSIAFPGPGLNAWVAVTQVLIAAIMPIIQYAWTFFYLRLVEVDEAPAEEVGPAYAATGTVWSASFPEASPPPVAPMTAPPESAPSPPPPAEPLIQPPSA